MSNIVTVKISGLDELQKRLEQDLPAKARSVLKEALKDGAAVVEQAIGEEAPVGEYGWLRGANDTKFRSVEGGYGALADVGPSTQLLDPTPRDKSRAKPASVIGRFVEFGTRKMAANPYITRAYEKSKGNALDAIIAKLRELLK